MDIKSWLHTVLQEYRDPDRTFRDVDTVLELYKSSLKPKMDTHTYNDGRTELLLCIHGTVPITYLSNPYNIPVAFWIPIGYPHFPPIPYVKPTANMVVREGKHVDKSGLCYHPYLSEWRNDVNNHTLLKLIAILQQVFGESPPVYTKPDSQSYSKTEDRSMSPSTSHSLSSTNSMPAPRPLPISPATTGTDTRSRKTVEGAALHTINQGVAGLTLSPSTYSPVTSAISAVSVSTDNTPLSKSASLPVIMTSQTHPRPSNAAENNHDRLFHKVSMRLEIMKQDVDEKMNANQRLRQGEVLIQNEHMLLAETHSRLQENMKELETKLEKIDNVIQTVNAMPDVAVDEALCGTTVVYNQLFDLVGDDNAIVDTIFYLASALNSERIDLTTFTKCTRILAREQFMKRALVKKILDLIDVK